MDTGLVIMAAGMGSRFGGLKQAASVGPNGEMIIDYSVKDALKAGFNKFVFVIRKDIEKDFREACGKRIEKIADVSYVFQELDKLPNGFTLPGERTKPWGTGHAVLMAKDIVDYPFVVINADDFYGSSAYKSVRDCLVNESEMCMAGYKLYNTLSENGTVSRGVCESENGFLKSVTEHTDIPFNTDMPASTIVSMNFWGFKPEIFDVTEKLFVDFLTKNITEPKKEFYIPYVVDTMIHEMNYRFKIVDTDEKWYGITYKEDMPLIKKAISDMESQGLYN